LTIIELDDKGRALLPSSLRKKLRARRFEVRLTDGKLELVPLEDMKALKGKYRHLIRTPWVKLEEKSERLVRAGRR